MHLLKKSPKDSFVRLTLPLSTSIELRESMLNARGHLRVGRLLEELDSFAGCIAQLHVDDGDVEVAPPLLVTAAFDRIDNLLSHPIPADEDITLEGCVTFAGRSSLNIAMDVLVGEGGRVAVNATTTFVARDAAGRSVTVPRLEASTPHEEALWEAGKRAQEERKASTAASLFKVPPTPQELAQVHALFIDATGPLEGTWAWTGQQQQQQQRYQQQQQQQGSSAAAAASVGHTLPPPTDFSFVEETRITSTHVTHPQDRNIYGRVFGGYLMRLAYETAWAAGLKFTRCAPRFLSMSDVLFRKPVEVGDLLTLTAEIAYSAGSVGGKHYVVQVEIVQERPYEKSRGGQASVSNQLSFCFATEEGVPAPRLYPKSYSSSMRWVAAARGVKGIIDADVPPTASRFPQEW